MLYVLATVLRPCLGTVQCFLAVYSVYTLVPPIVGIDPLTSAS